MGTIQLTILGQIILENTKCGLREVKSVTTWMLSWPSGMTLFLHPANKFSGLFRVNPLSYVRKDCRYSIVALVLRSPGSQIILFEIKSSLLTAKHTQGTILLGFELLTLFYLSSGFHVTLQKMEGYRGLKSEHYARFQKIDLIEIYQIK